MDRCLKTLHALSSHKCPSIVINMEQRNLYSVGAATPPFDLEFNLGKLLKTYTFILMVRKVPKPHTFLLPESAKTVIAIILE